MEYLSQIVEKDFGVWYAQQWRTMDTLCLLASVGIWAASASAKRAAVISPWNVHLRYVFITLCILLLLLLLFWNQAYLKIRERAFAFLWQLGMLVISTGDTFIVPALKDDRTNDFKVFRYVLLSKWPMVLFFFFGFRLRLSCMPFAHFPGLMMLHLFSTSAYNEAGLDNNVYVQAVTYAMNRTLKFLSPALMWPLPASAILAPVYVVTPRQAVTCLWAFTHACAFWSAFCWLALTERGMRKTFTLQSPRNRCVLVDDSRGLAIIMAAAEFFLLLHLQPFNIDMGTSHAVPPVVKPA